MVYFKKINETGSIATDEIKRGLYSALDKIGKKKKVLAVPPDFTRFHSQAGILTSMIHKYYQENLTDILPALGTHSPMSRTDIKIMFPDIPLELFRVHNWRKDIVTAGVVGSDYISEITEGKLNFSWPAQVNKLIWEGCHDLILSIGQVVPHEVIGMANYNKNILIGTGGAESINKSHFIGAVHGLERIMGHTDNPVRKLLNYASAQYLKDLPIVYIQTVVRTDIEGKLSVKGLFIGDDEEVFQMAAELSLKVNLVLMKKPLDKVVVYLDPAEYKSTWLGNKSIYRTRMALADGGELIVIAPGLKEFGEDPAIDKLIRRYAYKNTPEILKAVEADPELRNNLSAAAHLIHGSTEGRFSVTYCPGKLSKAEIESVNFRYAPLQEMIKKYDPDKLKEGMNRMENGESVYFISNPALGLWACEDRFYNY